MTLSTTLTDRFHSLLRFRPAHSARLRKALAGALALLAVGLAVGPDDGHRVVAASRDLPPGVALTENDLHVVSLNRAITGSFNDPAILVGKMLTAAARTGEPLTDARITSTDPGTVAVAVRLADETLTGLLRPGSRVDVISPDAQVLAENATVRETTQGRVVLILDRREATQVAATSLEHAVAVTLR